MVKLGQAVLNELSGPLAFTDFALLKGSEVILHKNLSTPQDRSIGVMTGLGRMSLWNAINSAIVVLVLCAVLIPIMGVEGAAIAGAMSTVVRYLTATVVLWRVHGIFLPLGLHRAGAPASEAA